MALAVSGELWIFSRKYKLPADADTVLGQMARAGYSAVEGEPDAAPLDLLRKHRLQMTSCHTLLPKLLDLDPLIRQLHELSCRDLAISGLLEWHNRSADDYRRAADVLSKAAPALLREGIALHYHNHDFEFACIEAGHTGYDLLLQCCSPDVKICADLGWIWYAGRDPITFVREHASRIGMVHLRDFAGKLSMPLGEGKLPLPAILAAVRRLPNLHRLVIEQDPPANPATDMATSLAYISRLL